jgi:hypothetical protein
MDVVNFDALVAQEKILLASQVNLNEDYFIIGKHDNTYTTRSFKATDYPIWAIKAKDVVGLTEPTYTVGLALMCSFSDRTTISLFTVLLII